MISIGLKGRFTACYPQGKNPQRISIQLSYECFSEMECKDRFFVLPVQTFLKYLAT